MILKRIFTLHLIGLCLLGLTLHSQLQAQMVVINLSDPDDDIDPDGAVQALNNAFMLDGVIDLTLGEVNTFSFGLLDEFDTDVDLTGMTMTASLKSDMGDGNSNMWEKTISPSGTLPFTIEGIEINDEGEIGELSNMLIVTLTIDLTPYCETPDGFPTSGRLWIYIHPSNISMGSSFTFAEIPTYVFNTSFTESGDCTPTLITGDCSEQAEQIALLELQLAECEASSTWIKYFLIIIIICIPIFFYFCRRRRYFDSRNNNPINRREG
ncbi:MAG: hypothetical protein KDD63_10505 [Bacteroidetes bacterium]|nr:hypothetical protein [Bacteroidota bacterium]MCB0852646.1 hypothetical protein [Bacteroidota bacterium]